MLTLDNRLVTGRILMEDEEALLNLPVGMLMAKLPGVVILAMAVLSTSQQAGPLKAKAGL